MIAVIVVSKNILPAVASSVSYPDITPTLQAIASSTDTTKFKMLVALVRNLCREVNESITAYFCCGST
jgi:hypothetical protein